MSNANTPAFPIVTPDMPVEGSSGLTKRELFAALAMQGCLANADMMNRAEAVAKNKRLTIERVLASDACKYADALLAELAK